ncbi:hypothetical protein, partial [Helicobacter pylori]|uniref:hypothetical protein n=1 Tax=Helicobacter pylori TaxID=210 RepID=UPI001EE7FD11
NTALFKSGNVGRCRDREMFFSLAFLSFSLILLLMLSVWFKFCWFVLGVYGLFKVFIIIKGSTQKTFGKNYCRIILKKDLHATIKRGSCRSQRF